jgi:hypothetical protein
MCKKRQNVKRSYARSTRLQSDDDFMQRTFFGHKQLEDAINSVLNDEAARAEQDESRFECKSVAETRRMR